MHKDGEPEEQVFASFFRKANIATDSSVDKRITAAVSWAGTGFSNLPFR